MDIAVCFKVTPDLDHLTVCEAKEIAAGTWDVSFARPVFGAYDEAALESALRLRDEAEARGMPYRLMAVTAGPCQSRFFTELFALGFHRVLHAETEGNLDFSPVQTAHVLAGAIMAAGGANLVLTGQQAAPGESGIVPALLASELGIAYMPRAVEVQWTPDVRLATVFQTDTGVGKADVRLPVLCAVENAHYPHLRLARLKDRLAAANRHWEIFQPGQFLQTATVPATPCRLWTQAREGNCRFLEEAEPAGQAAALLRFAAEAAATGGGK